MKKDFNKLTKLRTFFAIELDTLIKQQLKNIILILKNSTRNSVKWVKEDHLHFTLRFLGNVSINEVNQIIQVVSERIKDIKSFDIEFQDIILFPSSRPRIIALGIRLTNPLAELVQVLESSLSHLGFEQEDRPFLPHITLGRIISSKRLQLQPIIAPKPKLQAVKQIIFFKSQLTPNGSIYTPLHCLSLMHGNCT